MNSELYSDLLFPLTIAIIMFNLGLSLEMADFRRIFIYPKALIWGLICQIVILPVIAFAIAYFSGLPDVYKIGLIIIAACPGGATSNLITYYLKGDVPLSISLTSINSLLIIVTIPVIVYLGLHAFGDKATYISVPFWQTALNLLLMILAPTFLGLLVRAKFPETAKNLEKVLKVVSAIFLAVVFIIAGFQESDSDNFNWEQIYQIAPYTYIFNVLGMFAGFYTGRVIRLNLAQQVTLAVEVGIRNSALAITIASSSVFLGNIDMAIPALIYGLFTFFNALIIGVILRKWPGN